jgi:hypothetical protein
MQLSTRAITAPRPLLPPPAEPASLLLPQLLPSLLLLPPLLQPQFWLLQPQALLLWLLWVLLVPCWCWLTESLKVHQDTWRSLPYLVSCLRCLCLSLSLWVG